MGVRHLSDTYLTPLAAAFAETLVTAQAGILIASGRPVITSRSRRRQ